MFCTGNRHNDEERGQENISAPGGLAAQPQHEEIGTNSRNDPGQSPEESRKQHQDFDDGANDLWSLYGKEAQIYYETWIKTLEGDMGGALIFAGLFSAVLTAFVVLKLPDLKVNPADQSAYYQNQTVHLLDRISQQLASTGNQISTDSNPPLPYPTFHPSASDRRVNTSWLLSLVCSLFAAFLATLVQQWSKTYMHIFQHAGKPLQIAQFRVFLFEGSESLPALAEIVLGLIHFSLILFFWGLGDIILHVDATIFVIILVPITACICLYVYYTIAPIWNPQLPYRTPFSTFIWFSIQKLSRSSRYSHFYGKGVKIGKHQEQSSKEETESRMNRDVGAIQWLVDRINGSDQMQTLVLAIPGSFNGKWGQDVWKRVLGDPSTSLANLQTRSHPGFSSAREDTTVYGICRHVRYFFNDEGSFMDDGVERARRMRGYIESVASLVCCSGVELGLFGEVGGVLSEVGEKHQTNKSLTIRSNPLFTVRWTCLSLVAIKQILNDHRLQEIAWLALNSIAPFQTNTDRRDTVAMALTAVQKMDDDLMKAWEAVLDLRLALGPWSQNQNKTQDEIRGILNTCEAPIQELERIASEAVGLKEIDWRIRYLQKTMEEVTHKLTRRLPGVFFYELPPTAPYMTSEASDLPYVQTTPLPPQLLFPGQLLQSTYVLGQRLRDIVKRKDTEWDEETLKSLEYLHEVPIPLSGLNFLMERQLWRLLDLRDGGGLGFTIELFFLALRQLSSVSPSPDESSSSGSKEVFFAGTFDVITSNWKRSKDSAGTQRILLDLLCDLIIHGRGIFSDFRYPRYIVEMLLDLVGNMIEGLGETSSYPHIDDLLDELMDPSLMNRMNIDLRDEALSTIRRSLNAVSSQSNARISHSRTSPLFPL